MKLYTQYPRTFGEGNVEYPLWVSDTQKRANDYALAKDFMDYFDMANEHDPKKIRKMQENLELHAGRWPDIENINPSIKIQLGDENVVLGSGTLNHYPIIDRVSKSVVSDLQIRPLIPIIRDNSSKARNHRDRVRLERVKQYFQNAVILPELQRITQQYDMEMGYTDPIGLPIEAQQQREFDIQQRLKQETPEEIFNAMERLNTPDELVAQALLKEGLRYVKARRKFATGGENAVVIAEEYYRIGIMNKKPMMEALNPKWVIWGGSEDVIDCEDGQFAKYTKYLTPEDAITRHATHLAGKDVKRLSDLYSEIPGYSNDKKRGEDVNRRGIERRLVDHLADNPELQKDLDPRTREGQEKLKALYANLSHYSREGFGIKETYITWRWTRRVKFVKRLVNGVLETYIRDHHYRKDPFAGDIEVEEHVIPQVWHGTKLGDEFYIDVKPIEYQYTNISDPFDVKLGIYGGKYHTFQNNVKNASLIDLGKPWQYRYNVLMQKMEEHQATDIGKIFLGTSTMRPKSWSWAQWYKSLFVARTAIVRNHREGINNLDANFFRSIDLSRTDTIASDIQQLEYIENKIITSMYYSPQKIGDISQYATNRNTQVAIQGVDRQMFRFHERNREIKENVLNSFLHLCLYAYKDDEQVKATVLDDFLKAHYELNFNTTEGNSSNFTLHVVDDFQESEKLDQMRNLALTFLQNGMTASQLAALMEAESVTELKQLLEDIERQQQKAEQEKFQREQALLDEQRKTVEMQMKLQQEFLKAEADREREVKIRLAEINSLQLENASDVDRNKINDALQRTMMEIESKERIEANRLNQEKELAKDKFELENKKIEKMSTRTRS